MGLKYRGSPNALTQHLQREHRLEYEGAQEVKPTAKIETFFKSEAKKPKYKSNHPKQVKLRSKLVEWVVDSNRPMSVVDDQKLVEAFEIADEQFKMPSRYTIKKDIEKLFKVKKAETIKEFEEVEYFTETNDAGSLSGVKSFIDINAHWVTEDFKPKKKILDVLEMKEAKSAANYRRRVDETRDKFKIKEKTQHNHRQ